MVLRQPRKMHSRARSFIFAPNRSLTERPSTIYTVQGESMLQNASARYSRLLRRSSFLRRTTPSSTNYGKSLSIGYQCPKVSGTLSNIWRRPLTTRPVGSHCSIDDQDIEISNDTIYALSTGVGVRAGIAIVRISGPACLEVGNCRVNGHSHICG